jgi:hypothetical protein
MQMGYGDRAKMLVVFLRSQNVLYSELRMNVMVSSIRNFFSCLQNMEYLLEEAVFILLQPKLICCGSIYLDKAGGTSCWVVLVSLISFFFCMQRKFTVYFDSDDQELF